MATTDPSNPGRARRIPAVLAGMGVAIFVAQVAVGVAQRGIAGLLAFETGLGVVLTGLFSLVVVGGVLWHRRGGLAAERYPRLAAWVGGFGVVVVALNLVMIAAWTTGSVLQDAAWAVQAAAMGTAAGMLFGSIEARAIGRARLAERARVHAEEAEAQREWLEYLNGLLRHEVLNTANVVVGYADLLLEEHQDDDRMREHVELIADQSRQMTDVIQDVRLLIEASQEAESFDPVDVVAVIEDEVASVLDRRGEVAIETSLPNRALVPADDLVARVFSNLIANAIEHNDAAHPEVRVSVETASDAVTVRVADNGPGVPEHERTSLFEPAVSGDHGMGLYLVRTLADRYSGTVELTETGPDGSVFTVELPRVASESTALTSASTVTAGAT